MKKGLAIGATALLIWAVAAGGMHLLDQHNKQTQLFQVQKAVQDFQPHRIEMADFSLWKQKNIKALQIQDQTNQSKVVLLNQNATFIQQAGLGGEVQKLVSSVRLENQNALNRLAQDEVLVMDTNRQLESAQRFKEQVSLSNLNQEREYPDLKAYLPDSFLEIDQQHIAAAARYNRISTAIKTSTTYYVIPLAQLEAHLDVKVRELHEYQSVVTTTAQTFQAHPDLSLIKKTGETLVAQYEAQRKADLDEWAAQKKTVDQTIAQAKTDGEDIDPAEIAQFEKDRLAGIQNINQVYDAAKKQVLVDQGMITDAFAKKVGPTSGDWEASGGQSQMTQKPVAQISGGSSFLTDMLLYHWLMNSGSMGYGSTQMGGASLASQAKEKDKDRNDRPASSASASFAHTGGVYSSSTTPGSVTAPTLKANPYLSTERFKQMYNVNNPSSLMGQRLTQYSQLHGVKPLSIASLSSSKFSGSRWSSAASKGGPGEHSFGASSRGGSFGG